MSGHGCEQPAADANGRLVARCGGTHSQSDGLLNMTMEGSGGIGRYGDGIDNFCRLEALAFASSEASSKYAWGRVETRAPRRRATSTPQPVKFSPPSSPGLTTRMSSYSQQQQQAYNTKYFPPVKQVLQPLQAHEQGRRQRRKNHSVDILSCGSQLLPTTFKSRADSETLRWRETGKKPPHDQFPQLTNQPQLQLQAPYGPHYRHHQSHQATRSMSGIPSFRSQAQSSKSFGVDYVPGQAQQHDYTIGNSSKTQRLLADKEIMFSNPFAATFPSPNSSSMPSRQHSLWTSLPSSAYQKLPQNPLTPTPTPTQPPKSRQNRPAPLTLRKDQQRSVRSHLVLSPLTPGSALIPIVNDSAGELRHPAGTIDEILTSHIHHSPPEHSKQQHHETNVTHTQSQALSTSAPTSFHNTRTIQPSPLAAVVTYDGPVTTPSPRTCVNTTSYGFSQEHHDDICGAPSATANTAATAPAPSSSTCWENLITIGPASPGPRFPPRNGTCNGSTTPVTPVSASSIVYHIQTILHDGRILPRVCDEIFPSRPLQPSPQTSFGSTSSAGDTDNASTADIQQHPVIGGAGITFRALPTLSSPTVPWTPVGTERWPQKHRGVARTTSTAPNTPIERYLPNRQRQCQAGIKSSNFSFSNSTSTIDPELLAQIMACLSATPTTSKAISLHDPTTWPACLLATVLERCATPAGSNFRLAAAPFIERAGDGEWYLHIPKSRSHAAVGLGRPIALGRIVKAVVKQVSGGGTAAVTATSSRRATPAVAPPSVTTAATPGDHDCPASTETVLGNNTLCTMRTGSAPGRSGSVGAEISARHMQLSHAAMHNTDSSGNISTREGAAEGGPTRSRSVGMEVMLANHHNSSSRARFAASHQHINHLPQHLQLQQQQRQANDHHPVTTVDTLHHQQKSANIQRHPLTKQQRRTPRVRDIGVPGIEIVLDDDDDDEGGGGSSNDVNNNNNNDNCADSSTECSNDDDDEDADNHVDDCDDGEEDDGARMEAVRRALAHLRNVSGSGDAAGTGAVGGNSESSGGGNGGGSGGGGRGGRSTGTWSVDSAAAAERWGYPDLSRLRHGSCH